MFRFSRNIHTQQFIELGGLISTNPYATFGSNCNIQKVFHKDISTYASLKVYLMM